MNKTAQSIQNKKIMNNIDTKKETIFLSDDKIFFTIEGEGEYVGQPSVFMRMSMCNLTCKNFASEASPNGCDSYISWSVKNKMTFDEIFQMMEDKEYISHLRNRAIFKLTGGEKVTKLIRGGSGSYNYATVLTDANRAYSWGNNDYGVLGIGTTTNQIGTPQLVKTGTGTVTDIANGSGYVNQNTTLYLYSDGALSVVGYGSGYANGDYTGSYTTVVVPMIF
jgi:hypothetical protein